MKLSNVHLTQLLSFSYRKEKGPLQFIKPVREWAVCLFASFIVALGLFGYAGLDFKSQLNDKNSAVTASERVPRYNPNEAEEIIRYYEGRTRTFTTLVERKAILPIEEVQSKEVAGLNGEG